MTDKELWEKSQVWESSDDGRGKLKILESVEKFAELVRANERKETDRLRALCDELFSELYVYRASKYLKDTTEAIRARGKKS